MWPKQFLCRISRKIIILSVSISCICNGWYYFSGGEISKKVNKSIFITCTPDELLIIKKIFLRESGYFWSWGIVSSMNVLEQEEKVFDSLLLRRSCLQPMMKIFIFCYDGFNFSEFKKSWLLLECLNGGGYESTLGFKTVNFFDFIELGHVNL